VAKALDRALERRQEPRPATASQPQPVPPSAQGPGASGSAPRAAQDAKPSTARVAPAHPAAAQKRPRVDLEELSSRHLAKATTARTRLEGWLGVMVEAKASDLILRAGGRPCCRIDGKIGFLPGRVPETGPFLELLEGILGRERLLGFKEKGSADAALSLDGLGRFRLNAYKQMGEPALVIRRIATQAPSLDALGLPAEELRALASRKRGLVLVTGIAGSGKSTTLAALIQAMNESVERHVVTLEDPVELIFQEERCVISQREVGVDVPSFHDGLRHALRQSPDVLLIGEMRDAETVNAALDATETGHLVLSTLHTVNAPQTVERILSFFPAEQHREVRLRLADNIAGVLSQRLVPRANERGLVPAYELLQSTPHVRELLFEGKTGELARAIESGMEKGLVSFNQCLRRLVLDGQVTIEDALATSDRPEELVLLLRGISGGGAKTDGRTLAPDPAKPGDGLRLARPA
jgi:twitching motility protein PilT